MKACNSPWWQVLVAFSIQAIGSGALIYSYGIVALPLAETYAPTRMMLMIGMTAMTLAAGFLSPWLGAAIDRRSLRVLMAAGIVSIGGGFFALSTTTAMWQVPVIYMLVMSFGYVMSGPLAASTLLSRWFTRQRGLALGIAGMGTSFGGLGFPPLIQKLVELYEWRNAFGLIGASIILVGVPIVLGLARDRPSEHEAGTQDAYPGAEAPSARRRFDSTATILGNRNFWIISLAVGIMFGAFTGTIGNLVPFARDHAISPDRAALLVSIVAFMAIPGTLIFGALSDRLDLRATLGTISAVMASGLLFLTGSPDYPRMVIGGLLLGLGGGGMLPVWGALLAKVFGALDYGRVMGLMSPALMIFCLVTPPFAGRVFDVTGSYHAAFLWFAIPMFLVILLTQSIRVEMCTADGGENSLKKAVT